MGMEGYLLLFHGVEQSKRREGKELILSSSSESAKRDENPKRSKEEIDKDEWKKRPRKSKWEEHGGVEKREEKSSSKSVRKVRMCTHTHPIREGVKEETKEHK